MPAPPDAVHAVALDVLDTPAVVIDADKVEANFLRLRPHIKTHKMPHLAVRQIELGAIGITCQKLGRPR